MTLSDIVIALSMMITNVSVTQNMQENVNKPFSGHVKFTTQNFIVQK